MSRLQDLKDAATELADELSESAIKQSVTYKAFAGTTYATSTGQDVATYTSSTLNCYELYYSDEEIMQSGGHIMRDDLCFIFTTADLALPTIKDQIVFGSDTYNVIGWKKLQPNVRWKVQARRV